MALGINKDLEPLVRQLRRAGGSVEVTGSTHVRWRFPGGRIIVTGLTMSGSTAHRHKRQIQAALQGETPRRIRHDVRVSHRGKFVLVNLDTGEMIRNAKGFPRTFGTRAAAHAYLGSQRKVAV
jgi:hypothetical protein